MKQTIKKTTRILAGALLAATLLTTPLISEVVSGDRPVPPAHKASKTEPADDDPYSSSQADEDLLLILDDSIISRDMTQTPGLEALEPDSQVTDAEDRSSKGLKRETLEWHLSEEAQEEEILVQEEKEVQPTQAERKAKEKPESVTTVPSSTNQTSVSDPATEETSLTEAPQSQGLFLLSIANPDTNYKGRPLKVSDRQALEGLVMGEWGNDYIGAVLVAQCIRDSMVKDGINSAAAIKRRYGYTAPIKTKVSQTVKEAVSFVFDQGGSGVQHAIYYFYASNLTRSHWHETQNFIVQRKAVRFFSSHR